LFGHERGAFTGADRQRIGKFEQVDGGTLFLDEIGDMSAATQAKVLRLLQDGRFERVGGNATVHANVRIIAATNRDLESLVRSGEFRRDLYYRLKVISIELPPLRQRADDLPLLVEHFVRLYNRELRKNVRAVSPEALAALERHDWPGNVRELQSAIKYALVHAVGETITPGCLPPGCTTSERPAEQRACRSDEDFADLCRFARELLARGEDDLYRKVHSEVDRILLGQVLNHVDGNQVQAAQILGISRSTLRTRISDLNLTFEKRVLPDPGREE
ncbi:MAG: sigma 54-interacting transcriptional regulator, partial [Planctomycetaceae bacterium]